jgi:biopolymer transport protein ExbD
MGINVQLEENNLLGEESIDTGSESVVAEINITPLTDVFLVLLIIFMVTSTALVESEVSSRAGMKVVLPKANASGPVSQRRSDPVLTVTKGNEIYLGAKKVAVADLEDEIRKALQAVGAETLGTAFSRLGDRDIGEGMVLLEIGGNDMLGAASGERFAGDLEQLLRRVTGPGRVVVMMELPREPLKADVGRAQRRSMDVNPASPKSPLTPTDFMNSSSVNGREPAGPGALVWTS